MIYKVVEVKRNDRARPQINHVNFASRLETSLNQLVQEGWGIVEVKVGRYECIVVGVKHEG